MTTFESSEWSDERSARDALAQLVRSIHARGWAPATSSNFSVRLSPESFLISESGVDKELFGPEHLLQVSLAGRVTPGEVRSCSAETPLHAVIYQLEGAGAVLHVHSVNATVCSRVFAAEGGVVLQDYELLKAFAGVRTHEVRVSVPIFRNSQEMGQLSAQVGAWLEGSRGESRAPGFLLAGHGLYTWGKSLKEAKRHLEALDNLFECELRLVQLGLASGRSSA